MNAYELADELEAYHVDPDGFPYMIGEAIATLRQQADDCKLSSEIIKCHEQTMSQQADRIAELEKATTNYRTACDMHEEVIKKLEKENKELHAIAQRMAMAESDARKSLQSYKDAQEKQNKNMQERMIISEKELNHMRSFFGCDPAYYGMQQSEPVAWDGAEEWESLAWELCADECGEESCMDMLWTGGAVPEPWGEKWLRYEDEAKNMIALVRKHITPPVEKQSEPVAWVVQSKNDGSIFSTIAPCGYATFEKEFQKLHEESWVKNGVARVIPLYTTPQTKPLSDEEIKQIGEHLFGHELRVDGMLIDFARAIEAKVRGEK